MIDRSLPSAVRLLLEDGGKGTGAAGSEEGATEKVGHGHGHGGHL